LNATERAATSIPGPEGFDASKAPCAAAACAAYSIALAIGSSAPRRSGWSGA
jgi:hypothetical protein